MSDDTLYHRLGGYRAIAAATDHVLPRLLDDPLLKAYFNHLNQDSFRKLRQKIRRLPGVRGVRPSLLHRP